MKPWFQGGQTPLIRIKGKMGFENRYVFLLFFQFPRVLFLQLDPFEIATTAGEERCRIALGNRVNPGTAARRTSPSRTSTR